MSRAAAARGEEALAAQLEEPGTGLVSDVVACQCTAQRLEVRALWRLEAVEAATREQECLVLAHAGAHRAQLAAEAEALAQQPRLGVAAALAGAGELDRHEIEAGEIRGEIRHAI